MEVLVAVVVFGGAFGLGYWQLRSDTGASIWVLVGLAATAALVGLVLGFLLGSLAVFVIGVIAAAVLVFAYRWNALRTSSVPRATAATSAVPSAVTAPPDGTPEQVRQGS